MKEIQRYMNLNVVVLFLIGILMTTAAFAEVVNPIAMEQGLPFLDKVKEWLESIMGWPGLVAVVTIIEFLFRLVKTDKPKSIAWLIKEVVEQIATIARVIAELLDMILPQRTQPTVKARKKK